MEEKTLDLLTKEINRSIKTLGKNEIGSNKYGAIVDDTCKLIDKANAMIKEQDETILKREEAQMKKRERIEDRKVREFEREIEAENSKKNRLIEYLKIAVPVGTAICLALHDDRISKMLLKFEETGTLTNSYGRSFFGKVLKRGK